MLRAAVLIVTLAFALGGCSALTGRPFVQWTDDKAITARVKARLLAVRLTTVSRVHVDTHDRVVYLTGGVDSTETKARAEAAAMAVEGVRRVVSHLSAVDDRAGVAPSALPAAVAEAGGSSRGPGPRLEGFRTYDDEGRHTATAYTLSLDDLASAGTGRFDASRPVDHVTVHALNDPSTGGPPRYLLVLWHPTTPPPAR